MGVLLALASAVLYGVSDYVGGLLSRRADPTAIALIGQLGAFVLTLVAAPLIPGPDVGWDDLGWGALSGAGTGIGMVFLFRGLSRGNMSVVVPIVAVGGTAIPVLIGVAILGDRPSGLAWAGIAGALPSLWLISSPRGGGGARDSGVLAALLSSLGIAVQYIALAQAGEGVGLWPIVAGRCAASLMILPLARQSRAVHSGLRLPVVLLAVLVGAMAALALTFYMVAAQLQLVTVAVVLSSLYPVIPVLLGIIVLRESVSLCHAIGLVGAGAAVVMIALG